MENNIQAYEANQNALSNKAYNSDAEVVALFLMTKKRRSELTAAVYEGVLREFFKVLEYKPLKEITYADISYYADYVAAPNPYRDPVVLEVSTQNRKLATIKSLFKFCVKIHYLPFSPAEPLELKPVPRNVGKRLATSQELETMAKAANKLGPLHTVVLYFLCLTGCRRNELAEAMWKKISVTPNGHYYIEIIGKGSKQRFVKIPSLLWQVIVEYRKAKGLPYEIDHRSLSPLLVNKYGNAYTPQSIWRIVKEIVKEAGVSEDISTHYLRHTFATNAASSKDLDPWQLKNDLGHEDFATTNIYIHLSQGMEDTSADHLSYIDILADALED